MNIDEQEESLFLEMSPKEQREYIVALLKHDENKRALRLVDLRIEQRKHRLMNARAGSHDDPKSLAAGDKDD